MIGGTVDTVQIADTMTIQPIFMKRKPILAHHDLLNRTGEMIAIIEITHHHRLQHTKPKRNHRSAKVVIVAKKVAFLVQTNGIVVHTKF